MENMMTGKRYIFPCKRWLATDEDDGEIVREIPAEGEDIKRPQPCKPNNITYNKMNRHPPHCTAVSKLKKHLLHLYKFLYFATCMT